MPVYGLEKMDVKDSIDLQAAVPKTSTQVPVNLGQLLNVDMLEGLDFVFDFTGTLNAYTGTGNQSDRFPYDFVNKLTVPYQSSALKVGELDGHQWWLVNNLRNPKNGPYSPQVLLS